MKYYTSLITSLLLLSLPVAIQAQEVTVGDTIRVELPERPLHLRLQPLEMEQDQRAALSPFQYTMPNLVPPFDHHLRSFPDMHRVVPMPTHFGITGSGMNSLTNINRTALFSMEADRRLMLYFASSLGVVRTLPYGNINYYSLDVGAAFLLNHAISGSAGVFYRNALQFPMPITGGYLNLLYDITPGTQLFVGSTFQDVQLRFLGVSQQTLMLEGRLRQRLTDRWFVNAYGGTPVLERSGQVGLPMNPLMTTYYGASVEHWFNEGRFGVEGGVVWMRSMFTGQMQAQPRFHLHVQPRRR